MDVKAKRLKGVPQHRKDIVYGYSRTATKSLSIKNQSTPTDIMDIILLFYYNTWRKFNTDYHGKYLQIINTDDCCRCKKINNGSGYNTCIYGEELRATKCDRFDITIKFVNKSSFYMGFITSTVENSIKDWSCCLGRQGNKPYSVGLLINSYFNYFKLSDPKNEYLAISYKASKSFQVNDIFMLSFDFTENQCYIYHNSTKIKHTISLAEYGMITVAFSLRDLDAEIEIVDAKYFYN
eukprot:467768_1